MRQTLNSIRLVRKMLVYNEVYVCIQCILNSIRLVRKMLVYNEVYVCIQCMQSYTYKEMVTDGSRLSKCYSISH